MANTDRVHDADLGETLGVVDREVLDAAVAVVDEAGAAHRLARMQHPAQGIEDRAIVRHRSEDDGEGLPQRSARRVSRGCALRRHR